MIPPFARWALGAALIASLAACSPFPSHEPQDTYTLPASSVDSRAPERDLSLRVETPQANRTLSGSRILVMPDPHQFQAYSGVRWSDAIPLLLRDHLIDGLRRGGGLHAVVSESSRVNTGLELVSELRGFHTEYREGRAEAVIILEALLVDTGRQEVLASRRFEIREASAGSDLPAVVNAFGKAADTLTNDLLSWAEPHWTQP
ncbi:ABC-type transport auxiliary lipoprotein family protein [Marinimicrobium alkaliphilum]|uniref:ABC-type transport auxiliary lipoprotein family protein n=1 Tax=Marinimicrobium alkaliphilum TaxID=2202654 RepID=UPI000DBAA747|nr:ABC-type transport auxiliary lipoprotein family protein [Marinimicrobium alkaliphilum]